MRMTGLRRLLSSALCALLVFTMLPVFVTPEPATAATVPWNADYNDVHFVDDNWGWVAGTGGTLLRTRNGGQNWEVLPSGTTEEIVAVSFVDRDRGWYLTKDAWVWRTTNGGNSWTRMKAFRLYGVVFSGGGSGRIAFDMKFVDENIGFLVARRTPPEWNMNQMGLVFRTTNGGVDWSLVLEGPDHREAGQTHPNYNARSTLRAVDFVSPTHGWAVGIDSWTTTPKSVVYRTTTGGASQGAWIEAGTGITGANDLYDVSFATTQVGTVVGRNVISGAGVIRRSTNGGQTWVAQSANTTNALNAVHMLDTQTAWAVGENGTIRRTVDGGQNWLADSTVQSPAGQSWRAIQVRDPATRAGWLVGSGGSVRVVSGGGKDWLLPTPDLTGSAVSGLGSPTHPDQQSWYQAGGTPPRFEWSQSTSAWGIDGYSYSWSTDPGVLPNNFVDLVGAESTEWTSSTPLAGGTWYFRVKAKNGLGNWGPVSTYVVRCDATIPVGTISLEGGASFINAHDVALTSSVTWGASGPDSMRVSTDGGQSWGSWRTYQSPLTVTLPPGDGSKNVQVRFRDAAGNESVSSASASIVVDTVAPSLSVSVGGGAPATSIHDVPLGVTVTSWGASGAGQMRVSVDGSQTWDAWREFAPVSTVTLPPGDGLKTLHVQVRDRAGNTSIAFGTIVLDTAKPLGSILLNQGAAYTASPTVTLNSGIDFGASGPDAMRFRLDDGAWGTWEPFADREVTFAGNGPRTASAQFRDVAGNVSDVLTASIVVDTGMPQITSITSASHPDQNHWYPVRAVSLAWSASAMSGVAGYSYSWSQDGAVQPDELQDTTASSHAIASVADGVWYFKVRARNSLGTWGPPVSRTVRVDGTQPTGTISINNGAAFTAVSTVYVATSLTAWGPSGADAMQVSADGGTTWGPWEPFTASKSVTLPGTSGVKNVAVRVRDRAGNVSGQMAGSIVLDQTPPSATVTLNGGSTHTAARGIAVDSVVEWGPSGSGTMQFSFDGGQEWGAEVPFAASTTVELPGADGPKGVRVRFIDQAGNVSPSRGATIVLDTTAPTASLDLPSASNTREVALGSAVQWGASGSGAMRVRIGQGPWGAWGAHDSPTFVTLPGTEGAHAVTVQFRDLAGNLSAEYTREVVLDQTVPFLHVAIDDGQPYTFSHAVTLTSWFATGDTVMWGPSGPGQMRFRFDQSAPWGPWLAYSPSVPLTLPPGDGERDVFAEFRDGAGNTFQASAGIRVRALERETPIAGTNRYETAVKAAHEAYPRGLTGARRTVIIATGMNWPDALGGSALAGAVDGPILLVAQNSIPAPVMKAIEDLGAQEAIILGGQSAVGGTVESALKTKLGSNKVTRIPGADRNQTAELIASRVVQEQSGAFDGTAFVATGANFPDALAASPLAAANGWPLFLTNPGTNALPASSLSLMQSLGVKEVVVLGGTGVVPAAVETQLKSVFGQDNVVRRHGAGRYDTARSIAAYGVESGGLSWERVGISTGVNFPDALAGGVLMGKVGGVLLLTESHRLSPDTRSALVENRSRVVNVVYFGGTGALAPAVRAEVKTALQW